jgi:cell division septation protein DedD
MTRSPGRMKEQVQETVREIPVQAARLALFGVGRTLLLTDRVRKDYQEARESGLRPVLDRWRGDAERIAVKVVGTVTERVSGSGRHAASAPTTTEETEETPVARPPARKVNESLAAEPTKPADPSKPAPKPGGATKTTADSLPVPDYDTATIASVRARLRSLTAAQVSQLRDYEQANAARPDFLRMYENRIAKLTSG